MAVTLTTRACVCPFTIFWIPHKDFIITVAVITCRTKFAVKLRKARITPNAESTNAKHQNKP